MQGTPKCQVPHEQVLKEVNLPSRLLFLLFLILTTTLLDEIMAK